MTEGHHPTVDNELARRLRFVRLALITLLDPENPNRPQTQLAALRMLDSIGKMKGDITPPIEYNEWLYSETLLQSIQNDIHGELNPTEIQDFFRIVEMVADKPLDGNEENWAKEKAVLEAMEADRPMAGIVRLIVLLRTIPKVRRKALEALQIPPAKAAAVRHVMEGHLDLWTKLKTKPGWFTDEFIRCFSRSQSQIKADGEEKFRQNHDHEEAIVVEAFIDLAVNSPEVAQWTPFFEERIAAARAEEDAKAKAIEDELRAKGLLVEEEQQEEINDDADESEQDPADSFGVVEQEVVSDDEKSSTDKPKDGHFA